MKNGDESPVSLDELLEELEELLEEGSHHKLLFLRDSTTALSILYDACKDNGLCVNLIEFHVNEVLQALSELSLKHFKLRSLH